MQRIERGRRPRRESTMPTFVITPISKSAKPKGSKKPDSRSDFEDQRARVTQGKDWMWDDAAGNKSQVGGYLGFVFNGKCVQFHKVTRVASCEERLDTWAENVGQGNRKVLFLSKPVYEMRWADWIDLGGAKKVQGSNYPQSMNLDKLFRILEEKVAHAVIGAAADDEPAAKKPKTVGATSAHPAEAPDVVPPALVPALVPALAPANTKFANETLRRAVNLWCSDREAAEALYGRIGNWDTSGVTSTCGLFEDKEGFNDDISGWDVSSVDTMDGMFTNAEKFNQPLGDWVVSKVKTMSCMFCGAKKFNQPLDKWDVSKVENMEYMFQGAAAFNQPLDKWDVSNVEKMQGMFCEAVKFDQPLGDWVVSKVNTMMSMFQLAAVFNQPLDNWDVSKVTTMHSMFLSATAFNQPLHNWDVSNVNDKREMFFLATAFNQSNTLSHLGLDSDDEEECED